MHCQLPVCVVCWSDRTETIYVRYVLIVLIDWLIDWSFSMISHHRSCIPDSCCPIRVLLADESIDGSTILSEWFQRSVSCDNAAVWSPVIHEDGPDNNNNNNNDIFLNDFLYRVHKMILTVTVVRIWWLYMPWLIDCKRDLLRYKTELNAKCLMMKMMLVLLTV